MGGGRTSWVIVPCPPGGYGMVPQRGGPLMWTRREVLAKTAQFGVAAVGPFCTTRARAADPDGVEVNDVQSQLNATRVRRVSTPQDVDALQAAVRTAGRDGHALCVAGGRHAMGGQQFGRGTVLIDTTG